MDAGFHFELSGPLIALASASACGAGYYINTQIKLAAARTVEKATAKIAAQIESVAKQAMDKIDGLSTAINSVNVTLGRSEERFTHFAAEIQRLEKRIDVVELRGK